MLKSLRNTNNMIEYIVKFSLRTIVNTPYDINMLFKLKWFVAHNCAQIVEKILQ